MSISVEEAFRRLKAGNRRFRQAPSADGPPGRTQAAFRDVSLGQEPFAAILACSDSRVPVEMIFDQGPGHLFVVRVAGNVAGPTQLESLEFAVDRLGISVILVMGHMRCGAVAATLAMMSGVPSPPAMPGLPRITGMIADNLRGSEHTGSLDDPTHPTGAERLNAVAVARELPLQSEVVANAVEEGRLAVFASVYDLKTGGVEFIDEG